MATEKYSNVNWSCFSFHDLSTAQLYDILKLRAEVFVVEQDCVYQDVDGKDQSSLHVCGYAGEELVAYARLVPPGLSYQEPSIGRVATRKMHRTQGVGTGLMKASISKLKTMYPGSNIRISAQFYLLNFYTTLGFSTSSETYLEDGIPHIEMVLFN